MWSSDGRRYWPEREDVDVDRAQIAHHRDDFLDRLAHARE